MKHKATKRQKHPLASTVTAAMGEYFHLAAPTALRDHQKKTGMSLKDIATIVGTKRHAVWKWMRGVSRPMLTTRRKIENMLYVPCVLWLTEDEKKTETSTAESLQRLKVLRKDQIKRLRAALDSLGINSR